MTKLQFIESLGNRPQFITLITETSPKLVKEKSNPFQGLIKVSYRKCILNFVYEKSIQNQLLREGKSIEEYINGGRRNGLEYIGNSKCLMYHPKGEKYLWVMQIESLETKYLLNGKEIDSKQLDGFLYVPKAPQTQNSLDKKITCFNVKLDNILAIKANGITYQ